MNHILKQKAIRKWLKVIFLFLPALFFLLFESGVYASKPGMEVCSNCHTMHNSESGQSMRMDETPVIGAGTGECLDCHAENRAALLRMDCIGCHTISSASSIESVTRTPQVVHNSADLAAGNFKYVFYWNDRMGHNVHGFGALVNAGDLGNFPPGYNPAFDPSTLKYDQYNQLAQMMCAGANGCHGDRSKLSQMDAMKGAHHSLDNMLKAGSFNENAQVTDSATGNKTGTSYRMLLGVRGIESADWEANPSPTAHNEYKGDVAERAGQSYDAAFTTISDFCASCHGNFHKSGTDGIGGPASPWYRHPVDILLPATAGSEYSDYTQYNTTAPVARLDLAGPVGANVQGNAVVMCLSCHRAHASPNEKILRWNYKSATSLSEAISGCAVCHTSMN